MRRSALVAGLGCALLLGAFAFVVLNPLQPVVPSALALGAILCLVAFAALEWDLVRRIATGRQARLGSIATAWSLVVLTGFASLAFLAARHAVQVDLTHDKRNVLGPDEQRILESIPADGGTVEVFGVVQTADVSQSTEARDLDARLTRFAKASRRVTVRLVNAQLEPGLARELGVARLPSIVVRWKAPGEDAPRLRRSDQIDDRNVGRTIEEVLLGDLPPVHFLTGHGELALQDKSAAGLLLWAQDLRATNHDVRDLTLSGSDIPADVNLLIIAGPQADFLETEIAQLRAFEARGGRLLLLLSPVAPDPSGTANLSRLTAWLSEDFGMEATPTLVADLDSVAAAGDATVLVVHPPNPSTHPITQGFTKLLLMPITRALSIHDEHPVGVQCERLLRSGSQSWAETRLDVAPSYDAGADPKGPLDLAVAATRQPYPQEKECRLVVTGSAFMAANGQFLQGGNADFLRLSVDWLTGQDAALAARKKVGIDGTTVIPRRQGRVIIATTLVIPLIVMAAGLVIWWQRRKL